MKSAIAGRLAATANRQPSRIADKRPSIIAEQKYQVPIPRARSCVLAKYWKIWYSPVYWVTFLALAPKLCPSGYDSGHASCPGFLSTRFAGACAEHLKGLFHGQAASRPGIDWRPLSQPHLYSRWPDPRPGAREHSGHLY